MDEEAMSNADLIEQAREAIDNLDDFARMANVVATGPLLVLNSAIDTLELADKRIAELEAQDMRFSRREPTALRYQLEEAERRIAELERCKSCGANGTTAPCAYPSERAKELERKLAVAREALKQIPHALGRDFYAAATAIADDALAQIGGEDASS